jgi:HEAT repeat protein
VSDLDLLALLLEALVDPEKGVRIEAARAIGRIDRREAALLLRLRALVGDDEPEAFGSCLSGVLAIERADGIAFVRRFLDRSGEPGAEAALALGAMRDARAASVPLEKWGQGCDPHLRGALLSALAVSRQPQAVDFLLGLIQQESPGAAQAIAALAGARPGPDIIARLRETVNASRSHRLLREFEERLRGQ